MLSRRTQLTKNGLLKRSPYRSKRPKSTLSYRTLTFSSIVGSTPSVLSRFLNTLFDFVGGSRRGLQFTSTTPSPDKSSSRILAFGPQDHILRIPLLGTGRYLGARSFP